MPQLLVLGEAAIQIPGSRSQSNDYLLLTGIVHALLRSAHARVGKGKALTRERWPRRKVVSARVHNIQACTSPHCVMNTWWHFWVVDDGCSGVFDDGCSGRLFVSGELTTNQKCIQTTDVGYTSHGCRGALHTVVGYTSHGCRGTLCRGGVHFTRL